MVSGDATSCLQYQRLSSKQDMMRMSTGWPMKLEAGRDTCMRGKEGPFCPSEQDKALRCESQSYRGQKGLRRIHRGASFE